ncbi:MAG: nitroreductase/quinone reductase family protein [Nitriliruptorales bacterium]|nr:nitroreductase/quinone reductase family protein [Nitriliruptorales bacterium]
MSELPEELHDDRYCYLSTQGRVTGRRHTAELWFVPTEGGVYLMSGSGGLTQWCLNLQAEEQGVVRIGGRSWLGRAAFLQRDDDQREEALHLFHEKYDPPGKDRFLPWLRAATVVHMVFTRELTA